jgi:hypothetical protein
MDINTIKDYFHKFRGGILDQGISYDLKALKELEVSQNNQSAAKEVWCLEQVYKIIQHYLSAFQSLQDKKHFDAWCTFERAEIELSFLRKHLDFEDNKYYIQFYDRVIHQYQKLFPYQYFMSRESVIKKASCSICGETVTLRKSCDHRLGEIYNGEQCCHKIEEVKFLAMAIVKQPFDKYTVLFPEGMEYNYTILDNLMSQINGAYDDWELDILKEKKPEFIRAERNKPCPCKSGTKYKFCCSNTDKELFDHHRITVHRDTPGNIIPMQNVHTWK